MRTLVIGDIHGGLRALLQVMNSAKVNSGDKLIFLGDYVDGWSESAQVIDYLIELSTTNSCIFIKGNHDSWCEEWLEKGFINPIWFSHGGDAAIESYRSFDLRAKQQHLSFFKDMLLYYIDDRKRLFVHAGFTSPSGPASEPAPSNFMMDRSLWSEALIMKDVTRINPEKSSVRLKLFHEIFIGHTPTINFKSDTPIHACNLWNVDTGSAFYGRLTIMDVDTKQFWQSDPVKDLYPDEGGRNKN